jgi:hypothetical protein
MYVTNALIFHPYEGHKVKSGKSKVTMKTYGGMEV